MKMMCTNVSCPEALECGEEDCKSCFPKHLNCNVSGIKLANITSKLKGMDDIKKIDDKCAYALGQSQSDLGSNPRFCGLNEEDSEVFSRIFLK
jgi:hypothetical protein